MQQVQNTGFQFIGPGKLLDIDRIARLWVSPRERAHMTYHLLFLEGIGYDFNKGKNGGDSDDDGEDDDSSGGGEIYDKVEEMTTFTEDIAEWDYGDYEGLVVNEIRALRKERGLDQDREWDIWKDGCEGGE